MRQSIHPNAPTPERLAHSTFATGAADVPFRVLGTVQALLGARDIGQDAANAAERWYRDWAFAYEDVVEFAAGHVADTTTRHDAVSWQLTRGRAAARLGAVRAALGACTEIRLRLMLVQELSFVQIGRVLFPHLSEARARLKASAQCAMVLEQLEAFYAGRGDRAGATATRPASVPDV
ncbi:MAG: hypothetical protein ABF990_12755 [Acetobacter sp.]|uniref:hypothetical protein n=1 Tax=Acetobacter sp. TaxID=440 RepID=UPI0039EAD658